MPVPISRPPPAPPPFQSPKNTHDFPPTDTFHQISRSPPHSYLPPHHHQPPTTIFRKTTLPYVTGALLFRTKHSPPPPHPLFFFFSVSSTNLFSPFWLQSPIITNQGSTCEGFSTRGFTDGSMVGLKMDVFPFGNNPLRRFFGGWILRLMASFPSLSS